MFSLATGGRVVCSADRYHGTARQLRELLPRWGGTAEFVDTSDLAAVARALEPGASLLWAETPSNPLLRISDLAALADLAHRAGALFGCDNTFATPVLQQPLALGVDLVVHSRTKYLGGHSDLTGGVVIGPSKLLQPIWTWRKNLGQMFFSLRWAATIWQPARIEG